MGTERGVQFLRRDSIVLFRSSCYTRLAGHAIFIPVFVLFCHINHLSIKDGHHGWRHHLRTGRRCIAKAQALSSSPGSRSESQGLHHRGIDCQHHYTERPAPPPPAFFRIEGIRMTFRTPTCRIRHCIAMSDRESVVKS